MKISTKKPLQYNVTLFHISVGNIKSSSSAKFYKNVLYRIGNSSASRTSIIRLSVTRYYYEIRRSDVRE